MPDLVQPSQSTSRPSERPSDVSTDRVSLIDEAIAALTQSLLQLEGTRNELQTKLVELKKDRHLAVCERAPIRRLPPEILARIFEVGVGAVDSPPHFQTTVCTVSKHWRAVATRSPTVWNRIVISSSRQVRDLDFLKWTRLCLERSQASPFALSLNFSTDSSDVEQAEAVRASMELLIPHLPRCHSLKIRARSQELLAWIMQKINGVGDNITDMAILSSSASRVDFFQHPPPHLRSLSFISVSVTAWTPTMFPSLDRLTLKSIPAIPFHAFLSALQNSRITQLRLESSTFHMDTASLFDSEESLISIPLLKTLDFTFMKPAETALLLESTSTPALDSLSLRFEFDFDLSWFPRGPIAAQNIKHLNLGGCLLSGSALPTVIRILRRLPFLESLTLRNCDVGAQFFEALSSQRAAHRACPRLQVLVIKTCPEISGQELLDFVRGRASDSAVPKLRILSISECASFETALLDSLKRYVESVPFEKYS